MNQSDTSLITRAHSYSRFVGFVGWWGAASSLKSCPTLMTLRSVACQAPWPTGFLRQEDLSGLLVPSLGDLFDTRIQPCISWIGRQILYHWATMETNTKLWRSNYIGKIIHVVKSNYIWFQKTGQIFWKNYSSGNQFCKYIVTSRSFTNLMFFWFKIPLKITLYV